MHFNCSFTQKNAAVACNKELSLYGLQNHTNSTVYFSYLQSNLQIGVKVHSVEREKVFFSIMIFGVPSVPASSPLRSSARLSAAVASAQKY